jgi:hypothetical protein
MGESVVRPRFLRKWGFSSRSLMGDKPVLTRAG